MIISRQTQADTITPNGEKFKNFLENGEKIKVLQVSHA
jgi:hypothetical protein